MREKKYKKVKGGSRKRWIAEVNFLGKKCVCPWGLMGENRLFNPPLKLRCLCKHFAGKTMGSRRGGGGIGKVRRGKMSLPTFFQICIVTLCVYLVDSLF